MHAYGLTQKQPLSMNVTKGFLVSKWTATQEIRTKVTKQSENFCGYHYLVIQVSAFKRTHFIMNAYTATYFSILQINDAKYPFLECIRLFTDLKMNPVWRGMGWDLP